MSLTYPERFGAITKDTNAPTAAERVMGWLHRIAPVRTAADAGDERTLECAPNVLPMRATPETNPEKAVDDYCKLRKMPQWIAGEAKRVVRMKLRDKCSGASAYESGVVRAEFCRQHGIDPSQPRRPTGGAAA